MRNLKIPGNNKGVILIEAVLALGVIGVILTALVTALVSSVNSSNYTKDQSVATGYAQEGLEIARNDKDVDFSILQNGTYCLGDGAYSIEGLDSTSSPDADCSGNVESKYTRTIYISTSGNDNRTSGATECSTNPGSPAVFVESKVSWTDSKCSGGALCHNVALNSCFANLNRITP